MTPIDISGGAHGSLCPGAHAWSASIPGAHTKRKESTDGHEAQDGSEEPDRRSRRRRRRPRELRHRERGIRLGLDPEHHGVDRRPVDRGAVAGASGPAGSIRPEPVGCSAERRDAAHGRHGVQALAVAKVGSGATVVRVETDADGLAAYEVDMVKADGTPVTVYVDKSFNVVSVQTR